MKQTKFTMKILIFALAGVLLNSCLDNKFGASSPNKTEKEFAEPTGTLTLENLSTVLSSAIQGIQSIDFQDPNNLIPSGPANCLDDTNSQIQFLDWTCVARLFDACTGSGRTIISEVDSGDFLSIEYEGSELNCDGSLELTNFEINGEINVSTINQNLFCANITFSKDAAREASFNGCQNIDGDLSVRIDGENIVVLDLSLDANCSTLTANLKDRNTVHSATCEVASSQQPCANIDDVLAIDKCSLN